MQEQNMTKHCIIVQNENDFIILSKPLKVYLAIYHEFFFSIQENTITRWVLAKVNQ